MMNSPQSMSAEVARILATPEIKGDIQLAYIILNLHATASNPDPGLPPLEDFIHNANKIFLLVAPTQFLKINYEDLTDEQFASLVENAKTATKKVMDAVFAIGKFRRQWWDRNWDTVEDYVLDITALDRPRGIGPWSLVTPPLNLEELKDHLATLPKDRSNVVAEITAPSIFEVMIQRMIKHRGTLDDPFLSGEGRYRGKYLAQEQTVEPGAREVEVRECQGEGHCYWTALSQCIYNDTHHYAEIKANIRKYLMSVLTNPNHPRYRMYIVFHQQSFNVRYPDGSPRERSLTRCLHYNLTADRFGWNPHWYLGMNQIVADYYHLEVLEFGLPSSWRPRLPPNHPLLKKEFDDEPNGRNVMRARGRKGDPQIAIWNSGAIHYMSIHNDGTANPIERFETSDRLVDRVDPMPWFPDEASTISDPDDPAFPVPLPADSGFNDPSMRASIAEIAFVEGRRDFPGLMPALPRPAVVAAWDSQLQPEGALGEVRYEAYQAADGAIDWLGVDLRRPVTPPTTPKLPPDAPPTPPPTPFNKRKRHYVLGG